jgi:hypothetical protein
MNKDDNNLEMEVNNAKENNKDMDLLVINNFGKKDENIKKEDENENKNKEINEINDKENKLTQYNFEMEE